MPDDPHGRGYQAVDEASAPDALLERMDATGTWAATIELRAWERERLALAPGERLLDVGCGLGDAGLALAAALGPGGELVGIDVSERMVDAARSRAAQVSCRTRYAVGDVRALDEPDGSFDAVRSERTLQWVADPAGAVVEMARVLRPRGRLVLIDTDWSSLVLDVGAPGLSERVQVALRDERGRPSNVGRRLDGLAEAAGLTVRARSQATQTWSAWDPEAEPVPLGCFSMRSLAEDLVERGQLEPDGVDPFIALVHDAARGGRFTMSLTMHAVAAIAA